MKILVAPNSFKETLSAQDVARYIIKGLKQANRAFKIVQAPIADGGKGTSRIITGALKGRFLRIPVCGPLGKKISADYGVVPEKKTAVMELAGAAGLDLISAEFRNPMITTTRGVGEMLYDAANRGYKKIILGIGDSATIDCGIGALSFLGIRFLDRNGNEVEPNCNGLLNLKNIDDSQVSKKIKKVKLTIGADVDNILTGKNGAIVYARQKGAEQDMIPIIRRALNNFHKVVLERYGVELNRIPGSGAAGGIGGAMRVMLGAKLISGFELVDKYLRLKSKIIASDLVITGEGRVDRQSFYGKATGRIIEIAKRYNRPIFLIAGSFDSIGNLPDTNIKGIYSISPRKGYLPKPQDTKMSLIRLGYEMGLELGRGFSKS